MRQRIGLYEFVSIVVNAGVLLAAAISLDQSGPPTELNPVLVYCLVCVSYVLIEVPSAVLHELGHALAARWFRRPVLAITIGSGDPMLRTRVRGTEIQLSRNIFGGGRTAWDHHGTNYVRRCLVTAAGPLANFMVALAALSWLKLAPQWICLLIAGANFGMAVTNLIPHVTSTGRHSDGDVIRGLLRDRPAPVSRGATLGATLDRLFRQAEHDSEPLLAWANRALGRIPPDSADATEVRKIAVYALSRAGRFAEASRRLRGDRSPAAAVLRADMRVSAMLFGQLPKDPDVLSAAVEILEDAQSARASDGPDAAIRDIAVAHGLAVARLVQGRAAEARDLLPEVQLGALPSTLSALDATRAIACAHLGQREEAAHLLGIVRSRTPKSPWISPLEDALGLAA